jgi:hypothetical protein
LRILHENRCTVVRDRFDIMIINTLTFKGKINEIRLIISI